MFVESKRWKDRFRSVEAGPELFRRVCAPKKVVRQDVPRLHLDSQLTRLETDGLGLDTTHHEGVGWLRSGPGSSRACGAGVLIPTILVIPPHSQRSALENPNVAGILWSYQYRLPLQHPFHHSLRSNAGREPLRRASC